MTDSILRVQESNATSPREMQSEEARALHERLVAYAHFVAGDPESRSGVCSEHSYARVHEAGGARAGAGAGAGVEMRELLSAAPPPSPPAPLDVEHVSGCAPPALSPPALSPPALSPPAAGRESDVESDPDDADEEDAWEERVVSQAPSAAHARLAHAAIDALRELRLARLAHAGSETRGCGAPMRREQARAAARRLRRELAPLWAGGRAAGWLHGALWGALPRRERALYEEVVAELRRSVPRLAERLSPSAAEVPPDPLEPADIGEVDRATDYGYEVGNRRWRL
ncbi:Uncharacterized protein KIAA1310-like [Papilio machaon]|uniref:Uncharacterized protein KIAA1310-like n=1 Tax=Papilio machaon TaxID=76193 RepID=A0A194RIQ4_PAPMA|nr:Uncharacterized protein KIAA1310-like [Papilio machaon]